MQADMSALLDCETNTQQWRRNFIRVSASLHIKGYAHLVKDLYVSASNAVLWSHLIKETKVKESKRQRSVLNE